MFIGAEATVLVKASGKLAFRMNDVDADSASRGGKVEVAVAEVEPRWVGPTGSVAVYARIDAMDMLHVTTEGLHWEYGGEWGKVGEHDGHYPTMINGIQWWPKWTEKIRSETLNVTDLRLNGHIQLVRVDAKRGNVKLEQAGPNDVILRFTDNGPGSSQVGCVVRFSR